MRAADVSFVGALCYDTPELIDLLQSHLDTYEELLPHVFMGDFTRWVVGKFNDDRSDPNLRRLLVFIEESFSRQDESSQEIISVSFLENLPQVGEDDDEVRTVLGPHLRGELGRIG
jgi:hypothetical protein